jgi:uracil-DNA glycosylase
MADEYDPRSHGARCDACPLYNSMDGVQCVQPEFRNMANNGSLPLVFVGDAPDEMSVKQKRPFVGAAGVKLNDVLTRADMTRNQIAITYMILCRPDVPGESGRKKYDLAAYEAWLKKENKRRAKVSEPILESPIACCAPRLHNELTSLDNIAKSIGWPNGAVVMPLGDQSLRATMGVIGQKPTSGILKYRGSVIY